MNLKKQFFAGLLLVSISSSFVMNAAGDKEALTLFKFLPEVVKNYPRSFGIFGLVLAFHLHLLYLKSSKPEFVAQYKEIELDGTLSTYLKYLRQWYADVIIGQRFKQEEIVAEPETGYLVAQKEVCPPAGFLGNIEAHCQLLKKTLPSTVYLMAVPLIINNVYESYKNLAPANPMIGK